MSDWIVRVQETAEIVRGPMSLNEAREFTRRRNHQLGGHVFGVDHTRPA